MEPDAKHPGGGRFEALVDLTDLIGRRERLAVAASVFPPNRPGSPLTVMFLWPGGGYNRNYFDLAPSGRADYSQARHHAKAGILAIALDHLGVGDSTMPNTAFGLYDLAHANALAATTLLLRLREGRLVPSWPPVSGICALGLGHSYGALLLVLLQARWPSFAGVGFLGWSSINTVIPYDRSSAYADLIHTRRVPAALHPYRQAFHFDDVPMDIIEQDLEGYPHRLEHSPIPSWGSVWMPGGPHARPEQPPNTNITAADAANIDVPVLIALGERDVSPDPWLEPSAYRSSRDITLCSFARMAHAHNFASTRHLLWDRVTAWGLGITQRVGANKDIVS